MNKCFANFESRIFLSDFLIDPGRRTMFMLSGFSVPYNPSEAG